MRNAGDITNGESNKEKIFKKPSKGIGLEESRVTDILGHSDSIGRDVESCQPLSLINIGELFFNQRIECLSESEPVSYNHPQMCSALTCY